jgi:hypothetical protein
VLRTVVDSSSVRSVGYDARQRELELEYQGGRVYRYFDVPVEVYRGLLRADSIGSFVNDVVKPRYRFDRVD